MRRILTTLSLASCLTALAVSPANAADNESGTQYCQSGYTLRTDAKAIGNLYLKGPGDANYTYFYIPGAIYQVRTNVGPGGYWRADIGGAGSLDLAGTFGRCIFGS